MTEKNRQWLLKTQIEKGVLVAPEHFDFVETDIPEPKDGEFLTRTIVLGTSPAQRGYMSPGVSMFDKVQLGGVMRGRGVAVVEASRHEGFSPGDILVCSTGWQDYSIQRGPRPGEHITSLQPVSPHVRPLPLALGTLGSAGITAYFGLLDTARLAPGDTVVVSAAAGGVGSIAGQIARIKGCKVIGIAGSDDKCQWITNTLGMTAAINYKTEDVGQRLDELCPDGIDVFFDNVGGDILERCLERLSLGARVAICGYISTDYASGPETGPANYRYLVRRRASMAGFFVFDFVERFAEAEAEMSVWHKSGLLIPTEDVDDGFEHMPLSLASLFTGANKGIKLCRVAPDP